MNIINPVPKSYRSELFDDQCRSHTACCIDFSLEMYCVVRYTVLRMVLYCTSTVLYGTRLQQIVLYCTVRTVLVQYGTPQCTVPECTVQSTVYSTVPKYRNHTVPVPCAHQYTYTVLFAVLYRTGTSTVPVLVLHVYEYGTIWKLWFRSGSEVDYFPAFIYKHPVLIIGTSRQQIYRRMCGV